MRERSSAGVYEREEDLPLDGSKVDLASVALDAAGHRIDREAVNRDRRRGRRRGSARPTQLRAGPRRQLEDAERLRDVIVGTGVEE